MVDTKFKSKPVDTVTADTKLKSKPVAPVVDDEETAVLSSDGVPVRTRRFLLLVCCGVAVFIAVIAVVMLILSFTLLKVRDPTLAMNSVSVEWFNVHINPKAARPVLINVTLVGDFAIKNPNVDSMRFGVSTTEIYIDGMPDAVGVGRAQPGVVAARSTSRMRAAMDVLVDRVAPAVVTRVLFGDGEVRLASRTAVSGRVSVLGGLYGRRDVNVAMRCGVTLHVSLTAVVAGAPTCVADFSHSH